MVTAVSRTPEHFCDFYSYPLRNSVDDTQGDAKVQQFVDDWFYQKTMEFYEKGV
jgi:hypothetical protein